MLPTPAVHDKEDCEEEGHQAEEDEEEEHDITSVHMTHCIMLLTLCCIKQHADIRQAKARLKVCNLHGLCMRMAFIAGYISAPQTTMYRN